MSEAKILENDPLSETDKILRDDFYGRGNSQGATITKLGDTASEAALEATDAAPKRKSSKSKPTHYKVVCISLYTQDIENLEATVAELKRRGYTKANKSQLIRQALRQLDIDKLPPPQQ